ncbi:TonB-dependent receptor [Galbibacter sp. EGI 63066]|uniref:SusC/RagA family TonB-linked outer membrane protein n=1 Tax=Galbibacter sp. EGI 63066 TaxID=2993559 RepID=UPI002248C04E|nr:TonB-dependent receptor [Galbibacter sp. EGI 63066]MCX2680303.1 TonB-dependent receptor [Galbibacter sp. EGI 63066]
MKNKIFLWLKTILLALVTNVIYGQEKNITGTVTDPSGVPMPGVNVVVKGTQRGTSTDFDGQYSINASQGEVLVFSFIGSQTIEKTVGQTDTYDAVMQLGSSELDEVVVVGYGTQKRSDVTGAISSIQASSIEDGPPMAPEQILQGKITGVNIVQNSGQPGAGSTVRVRGISSISAGNDPLYVIDGVPLQFGSANNYVQLGPQGGTSALSDDVPNPLNVINPSDIESIDVLKDASATAIYGSRGANGVVIITTKSKKGTGETVTYDTFAGIGHVRENLPVLSADQYRQYAESVGAEYSDLGANTNWQDQIFRAAFSQNHNLSFAGGSETSKFRASFGYSEQEGIILSSALKKYTGRLNGSHRALDDKLKIGVHMSYAKLDDDKVAISSNINNEGGNILKDALRWAPTLPVRNEDGSFYQIGELRINPVSWIQVEDVNETDFFLGNANISYDILESLTLGLNIGYSNEQVNRFTNAPDSHPSAATEGGRASISKFKNTTSLMETTLTYDKQFGADHHVTFLAGYSFQRFQNENTFTMANQFVSTATKWNLIQSGNTLANTSFKDANRLASYYGRLNYKFKDKYLLTLTLRRDGSSRFGENNRWGTFPSGALAYNMTNESFLEDTKVSNLKFRIGYGITGNQEIPNNLYREQLSIAGSSVYVFGGQAVPSVLPTNYSNPDLKWEQTSQLNVGVDFGFFNQRLSGSVDYYIKNTEDLLLEFSTASPSVVETQWANVGEVENKGWEFNLNGDIINTPDFNWSSNLNFSFNRNEVKSLSNENFQRDEIRVSNGSGVVGNQVEIQMIRPGLPLGSFYGREYTGLDADGNETYLDVDGEEGADLLIIGDPNPDFTYGFNNTFNYKNFDLSVNMRGVVGNDIYNNTAAEFSYPQQAPALNVLESALTNGTNREFTAEYSSRWLEDGSYLRLDNLSLGYTFNTTNIDFLKKARIYVSGKNLFVITGYSGYDPEVRTRAVGIDYLMYPRPTTYLIGGSITF